MVCSRLLNSCAWARSVSVTCRVRSSSRRSSSSSVRSRSVVTEPIGRPRLAIGSRLTTSIRAGAGDGAVTLARPRRAARRASPRPPRARQRAAEGSRRGCAAAGCASSLISVTRPRRSSPTTPSRMPCSIASRCSTRPAISARLQAERLPLHPAGHQQRADDADRAGQPQVGEQVRRRGRQAVDDRRIHPADGDDPTTAGPAGLGEHGHDGHRRAAAVAVPVADPRPARDAASPCRRRAQPSARVGAVAMSTRSRPRPRTTRPRCSARSRRPVADWLARDLVDRRLQRLPQRGRWPGSRAAGAPGGPRSAGRVVCDCAHVTAVTPTRTTQMITTCSASSWPASGPAAVGTPPPPRDHNDHKAHCARKGDTGHRAPATFAVRRREPAGHTGGHNAHCFPAEAHRRRRCRRARAHRLRHHRRGRLGVGRRRATARSPACGSWSRTPPAAATTPPPAPSAQVMEDEKLAEQHRGVQPRGRRRHRRPAAAREREGQRRPAHADGPRRRRRAVQQPVRGDPRPDHPDREADRGGRGDRRPGDSPYQTHRRPGDGVEGRPGQHRRSAAPPTPAAPTT